MNGIHEVGGSIPPGSTNEIEHLADYPRKAQNALATFWPLQTSLRSSRLCRGMRRRDDCGVGNRRTGPKKEKVCLAGSVSCAARCRAHDSEPVASRRHLPPRRRMLCAMPIPVIVPCDHPFGMEAPADPPWPGLLANRLKLRVRLRVIPKHLAAYGRGRDGFIPLPFR